MGCPKLNTTLGNSYIQASKAWWEAGDKQLSKAKINDISHLKVSKNDLWWSIHIDAQMLRHKDFIQSISERQKPYIKI